MIEVELWHAALPFGAVLAAGELGPELSPAERARLGGSDNPTLRAQRAAAYALRRAVLGARLGLPPAAVPIGIDEEGRARLLPDRRGVDDIALSLSHTDGLVAFALASPGARGVGVDVERVRPRRNPAAVAARFFPPAEARAITAAAGDEQQRLFFAAWTRRESLAKATDLGLFAALGAELPAELYLQNFTPGPGHAGAWAVRLKSPGEVRVTQFDLGFIPSAVDPSALAARLARVAGVSCLGRG